MRVAIEGLGLIGGSLGLALRGAGHHVTALDVEPVLGTAAAAAASDVRVPVADAAARRAALSAAELVVLAAPVRVIEGALPEALALAPAVTDTGSTKRALARAAAGVHAARYLPGHPMAGAERGGVAQARAELFRGRRWLLCEEGVDAGVRARVRALVAAVGAEPVTLTAAEHDRAVARVSHLPQLLASALAVLAREGGALAAAGPAFAEATRVAGGPEAVWRDILDTNADEVAAALAELEALLGPVRAALGAGEVGPALALLARARGAGGDRRPEADPA